MKRISLFASAIFLSALVACNSAPESQEAKTEEAVEVNTEEQAQGATEFAVDTETSKVMWVGSKPTGQHNGTIGIQDGTLMVENGELIGGTITINMSDIKVEDIEDAEENQKLVGHLKSDDFFAVETHPTATFTIASVEKVDPATIDIPEGEYSTENPTHKITGNLKMMDTEKSVTFYANVVPSADGVSANAKFNIDRTAWNVSYMAEGADAVKDKFINNTVNVGFDLQTQAMVN